MKKKQAQSGFSLLELAVVLTVIGLVLGAMTPFMASLIRNARAGSQRETLTLISDVLADYAAKHDGCLPFAAAMAGDFRVASGGGDGTSDDKHSLLAGEVPWRSLGIQRPRDAATEPFRYIVAPPLAGANCAGRGFTAKIYDTPAPGFPALHTGPDAESDVIADRLAFALIAPGSDNALDAGHKLAGNDSGRYVLVRSSGQDNNEADSVRAATPTELRVLARRYGDAVSQP